MMRACLPGALLLIAVGASASSDGLTANQRYVILREHNNFRSNVALGRQQLKGGAVTAKAANMIKLVWDGQLAIGAKAYADKCVWQHDPSLRGLPWNQYTGENLVTSTNRSMVGLVGLWIDEWKLTTKRDLARLPRSKLSAIGHLTQMAWADTTRVGCGYQDSCRFKFGGRFYSMGYLVCRYKRGGNIYEKPSYIAGEPCSQCENASLGCDADTGLCRQRAPRRSTTTTTTTTTTTPEPTTTSEPFTTPEPTMTTESTATAESTTTGDFDVFSNPRTMRAVSHETNDRGQVVVNV